MISRLLVCFAFLAIVGCNQETKTVSPLVAAQDQITPTITAQDQMTAGSDVRIIVINAPGSTEVPLDGDDDELIQSVTGPGVSVGKTSARAAQSGFVFNITTGGTTPTATTSATGTASATQNPNQSTTASPIQDVKPEFTSAVPITVGLPGSAVSGSANAAGSGGQLSNPQANPTQTPQYTTLNVPAQYAADAISFLKEFLAIKAAGKTPVVTSQPE